MAFRLNVANPVTTNYFRYRPNYMQISGLCKVKTLGTILVIENFTVRTKRFIVTCTLKGVSHEF